MKPLTFGSLFAGIGGLDLGLERAGMECRWQVEIDDYARQVLQKHWPEVPRYEDVRYFLGGKRWRQNREAWSVDLICGGFPCQDISNAGKRAGIDGERSGLWSEYARIVRLLRPRFVLVENVAALLGRGLGRVVGDLASIGYDAEWDRIPAAALGAPHLRERIFIVAYPDQHNRDWRGWQKRRSERNGESEVHDTQEPAAHVDGQHGREGRQGRSSRILQGLHLPEEALCGASQSDAESVGLEGEQQEGAAERPVIRGSGWWATEPDLVRMVHGVPAAVDRIRCLGNAVVPQVAEWIGRRIIAGGNTSDRAD